MAQKYKGKFPGFPASLEKANWQFPSIINGYVHEISGAEFKVLWYILRHTYGWQKHSDRLSISQICKGIKRRDGEFVDKGTGLSRKWARKVLTSLEAKGFIVVEKSIGRVSTISPNITGVESTPVEKVPQNWGTKYPRTGVQSTPTITNQYNNNNVSTETELQPSYGREDINKAMDSLRAKLGGTPDGSQRENRRFAKLLLDRLRKDYPERDPVELVGLLLEAGMRDSFHSKNLTSFKYLYYHAQQIIQGLKNKKSQVVKIS